MPEQEPTLEEMISAAKLAIENYLATEKDDVEKAKQIIEQMGAVFMNTSLDEAQKTKVITDMDTIFTGLINTYIAAQSDVQRKDAANKIRIGFRNYLEQLPRYK